MNKIVAILTIVGGHFVRGRRLLGLGFLLLLVIAPFLAALFPALLSFLTLSPTALEMIVSIVYLLSIGLIWICSAFVAIQFPGRTTSSNGEQVGANLLEAIGTGLLAWFAIGVGVIVMIVGASPFADRGHDAPANSPKEVRSYKTGKEVRYRELPAADGSIMLLCSFELRGKPLQGESVRMIFADGYASKYFTTDDHGRFTMRLPPGEWRLVGPDLPSHKSREVRYEFVDALQGGNRTFSASPGPPSTTIRIRFWIE